MTRKKRDYMKVATCPYCGYGGLREVDDVCPDCGSDVYVNFATNVVKKII